MLSSLVIFAGILTLHAPTAVSPAKCQTAPLSTPKQGIAKDSGSQDGSNQAQAQDSKQTTPNSMANSIQLTSPGCDEACQQGRQNLDIQRKLEWFTGGLVIVGFLQVATMAWQAGLLRGTLSQIQIQAGHMDAQTKILGESVAIAKQSAETTRQQIELYVNAERARMTMDVREIGRSFAIDAKNTGNAIAHVTYARGFQKVLPHGVDLPPEPPYLSENFGDWDFVEDIESKTEITLMREDGEYGLLADLTDLKLCDDIRDEVSVLWVYGRICYGDGISPTPRETRFCYKTYVMDSLEIGLSVGGKAIYRLQT